MHDQNLKNITISQRENGIVDIIGLSNRQKIELEDIKTLFNSLSNISKGKKVLVIANTDMKSVKSISSELLSYSFGVKVEELISAAAFVLTSSVDKAIGNIFLRNNKIPFPIKLFTSESKAVDWLKEIRKKI